MSRIRRVGFVVCMGVWLAGCAETRPGSDPQQLQARAAYERGVKHFGDREAAPALAAFREAVALDPSSAIYRDALGLVFNEVQRPDLAIEQFQQAIALDPKYADAQFHLGVALAEASRWSEAVAAYRKALTMPMLTVPHFAHQNLGLALFNLKEYREAEDELRLAIALDPEMGVAYYNLGLVFMAEDRKDDAKIAFRRARDLGPQSPFGEAAAARLRALGEGG